MVGSCILIICNVLRSGIGRIWKFKYENFIENFIGVKKVSPVCSLTTNLEWLFIVQEFKLKAHLARHYATAHGLAIRSGSPRPIMKTRTAFYLSTTALTRLARRLCRHIMMPRHAARAPFWPINVPAIKQECKSAWLADSYLSFVLVTSSLWHLSASSSKKSCHTDILHTSSPCSPLR